MLIDIQLSHKSDECCVDGTIFDKNQLIPEYYTVNPFTITIIVKMQTATFKMVDTLM